MRILSWRHAAYWLNPVRLPEAARRVLDAWRGTRWCRSIAVELEGSGRLREQHGERLDAARERVEQSSVRLGGAGNLELIYDLCEQVEARKAIETGVAYGWSSLAILLSVSRRDGHLWSTDLGYRHVDGAEALGVAVDDELREHWTLLAGSDAEQVPFALSSAGAIDFAHYDSDKTPDAMMRTCLRLYDALRPGGVLMVDDVGDHLGLRRLSAQLGIEPTIVAHDGKYQGILRKPGPANHAARLREDREVPHHGGGR